MEDLRFGGCEEGDLYRVGKTMGWMSLMCWACWTRFVLAGLERVDLV